MKIYNIKKTNNNTKKELLTKAALSKSEHKVFKKGVKEIVVSMRKTI